MRLGLHSTAWCWPVRRGPATALPEVLRGARIGSWGGGAGGLTGTLGGPRQKLLKPVWKLLRILTTSVDVPVPTPHKTPGLGKRRTLGSQAGASADREAWTCPRASVLGSWLRFPEMTLRDRCPGQRSREVDSWE